MPASMMRQASSAISTEACPGAWWMMASSVPSSRQMPICDRGACAAPASSLEPPDSALPPRVLLARCSLSSCLC